MPKSWSPLRSIHARLAAIVWTSRGRRALLRGDPEEAVRALEVAVGWRPHAFAPLFLLGRGYLEAQDTWRAHRALARAREADPVRFAREARRCLALAGADREAWGRVLGVGLAGRGGDQKVATAARARGSEHRQDAAHALPYGDCADLDEYARFQAMPPISQAEVQTADWDRILEDLLED